MRALYFSAHGEPTQLVSGERPAPVPGPGEALVRVRTAALNHLDLFVLRGLPGLHPELPHVGGADGAGAVAGLGDGVSGISEGDEVVINPGLWCGRCEFCRRGEESLCVSFGVLGEHRMGTFAEYVVVSADALGRRPAHLDWAEAAAFPLTFLTAWRMLVSRARLRAGRTVLIHGIGGGVGLAALVIAKRLGAVVVVSSSSEAKLEKARAMGADATIDYTATDVAHAVRALTGKRGADVVVDSVGAATWTSSLKSAAKGGTIVTCGATTGPNPSDELRLVFWNQLSILGSTMGNRRDWSEMLAAVAAWELRPVIDSVMPLERGSEAYARLAAGKHFGKVVLAIDPEAVARNSYGPP
jgi:NADPH:quinone reductase-like Zn-dependent oxidoreductase